MNGGGRMRAATVQPLLQPRRHPVPFLGLRCVGLTVLPSWFWGVRAASAAASGAIIPAGTAGIRRGKDLPQRPGSPRRVRPFSLPGPSPPYWGDPRFARKTTVAGPDPTARIAPSFAPNFNLFRTPVRRYAPTFRCFQFPSRQWPFDCARTRSRWSSCRRLADRPHQGGFPGQCPHD